MLINRLQDHALGRCDMTPTQVKAASTVLRKTLPDLKPVKLVYEDAPCDTDAICASYHYSDAGKLNKPDQSKRLAKPDKMRRYARADLGRSVACSGRLRALGSSNRHLSGQPESPIVTWITLLDVGLDFAVGRLPGMVALKTASRAGFLVTQGVRDRALG